MAFSVLGLGNIIGQFYFIKLIENKTMPHKNKRLVLCYRFCFARVLPKMVVFRGA